MEKFCKKHQDALFDTSNGHSEAARLSLNIQMFDLLIKSPWQLIMLFFSHLTTAGKKRRMTLQYRDLIHVETSCICSLWFMFEKHASSQKSCSVNKINTEIHSQQWSHLGNIHFLSDLLKHTSLSSFIYGSNESTIGSVILGRKKQHKPVPTSPLVETCSLASGKGLFLAEDRPRCWMKDSK